MAVHPQFIPILPEQMGIPCPKCLDTHRGRKKRGRRTTHVRPRPLGIRRFHRCPKCGHKFRTIERLE